MFLGLISFHQSMAQSEVPNFFDMDMESLQKVQIGVATIKSTGTINETPAIVTLITREDIVNSGKRDLIDVLRQVPGLDFGTDVEGTLGMGIRGLWAAEGKFLLMVNGIEMNETMYASVIMGGRFALESIEKIEIIRGPGSAIYGGFAELAVINIVTLSGKELSGAYGASNYGQIVNGNPNSYANRSVNGGWGIETAKGLDISVQGGYRQRKLSNVDHTDNYNNTFNMTNNYKFNNLNSLLSLTYKNFQLKGLYEETKILQRDYYGENLDTILPISFRNIALQSQYEWKIKDKLSIIPKLTARYITPWKEDLTQIDTLKGYGNYDKKAFRTTENISTFYQVSEKVNIVGGIESYQDQASINPDLPVDQYFVQGQDTTTKQSFYNLAAFAQGVFKTKWANITAGIRYDRHSAYPQTINPRLGLTQTFGKINIKLLAATSYRAPVFENIRIARLSEREIKPEQAFTLEAAAKYDVSSKMYLGVNVFYLNINNPIIYTLVNNQETYTNANQLGSNGIELTYAYRDKWGYINVNYSFYTPNSQSDTITKEIYGVPNQQNAHLGLANHKVTANASIKIIPNQLTINPSLVWLGERKGYDIREGVVDLQTFKPTTLVNLFVNYTTPIKGLEVGLGGYNLLNENYKFIQAYNGGHNPLSGECREVMLTLKYVFQKQNKE